MKELVLLPLLAGPAAASLCSLGSTIFKGNWYCQAVKRISYKNVGHSGSYNRITSMNRATGECSTQSRAFSGPLAPLDEDMSVHLRGPLVMRQFAVYKPASGLGKREAGSEGKDAEKEDEREVHSHKRFHERERRKREVAARELAERAIGDKVTATINGQVVSWDNKWGGGPAPAKPAIVTATIDGKIVSWENNWNPGGVGGPAKTAQTPAPAPPPAGQAPPPAPPVQPPTPLAGMIGAKPVAVVAPQPKQPKAARLPPGFNAPKKGAPANKGDWAQVAYFNMDNATAEGLTFLNNMGGQGSGVWDQVFGNSLSFAARHARSGAAGPEVWNGRLESNMEVALFSSRSCERGNCGFVRPGSVAFEGFSGDAKAFFFEFQMPNDGTSGFNRNMPAIWGLNAQIPRVQQYGRCSCWTSGCGELDIFEVLDSGNNKAKSTIHKTVAGGSSDYFERPVDRFIKLAMVMDGKQVVIQQLRDDYEFSRIIDGERMAGIAEDAKVPKSIKQSVFRLGAK